MKFKYESPGHVFISTSTSRVQTPRSGIQSFFLCLVGSTSSNNVMPTQFQTAEAFGDNLTCIGIPVWHTFYVLSIRMIKTPHRGYLFLFPFKVAPYSFLSARALILKISWWRKLSDSTPKSHMGSCSKMPTNMASKLLKFVYRRCCVDGLRFQNICRLNRRPNFPCLK